MNDFRKSYQQMMNDMPAYSIDADSVLNEARHRKTVARRRRQTVMSSVFTLCLVCLFAAGTAKAAGYFGNVIRATDRGFVTGDIETMERAAVMEAEMTAADEEATAEPAAASVENESEAGIAAASVTDEEAVVMEEEIMREYDSIEAFESAETDAVIALPEIPEGASADIMISVAPDGNTVMFHYTPGDDRMIFLRVSNYADSLGHSSSTVYGDEVVNEREYLTKAGYTYTLLETMDENGDYYGLHAAIAVGTYEVIADFWGYSEEEALEMVESMDLTVYLSGGEN